MKRLGLLLPVLLAAACGELDEGIAAYEAARFDDAHAAFVALDDAAAGDASAELIHDRALAALGAGDPTDAARCAARLAAFDDPEAAGLGHFLAGNAAFARAERAAAQARSVESEPFAFQIAIRRAEEAAVAWCRASATRDAWPAAARNTERALRLAEQLRREQRDAAAQRERKTAGGGTPRIRPIPVDPDGAGDGEGDPSQPTPPVPEPGGDAEPGATATVSEGELTPAQVSGLLERLAAKEQEKRDVRRERQRAGGAGSLVKDW